MIFEEINDVLIPVKVTVGHPEIGKPDIILSENDCKEVKTDEI